MRRLSRKLRWARRQNARRSCESAFCETFVKIAIRCTGCDRMLLSGYHGCRVLRRCDDQHAFGGSKGSGPPECETFAIAASRLSLCPAPKVRNVSQNLLFRRPRGCKNVAPVRQPSVLQSLTCLVAARMRDIRHFSGLEGFGAARRRDSRQFRLAATPFPGS